MHYTEQQRCFPSDMHTRTHRMRLCLTPHARIPVLVMLAELSAPCTVIISMVRTIVMVCTSGIVPVVVRSYRVLKELPFCSAVTCDKHDQRFTAVSI